MVNPELVVEHIRRNILAKIKEAGYPSMEKFAFENGLDKTTVSRVVSGTRNPRIVTLVQIANGLEISLQDLLELDKLVTVKAKRAVKKGTSVRQKKKP